MMYAALTGAPPERTELARLINSHLAELGCILRPRPDDNQSFDIVTTADGRVISVASSLHTIAMINHWLPESAIQDEKDR